MSVQQTEADQMTTAIEADIRINDGPVVKGELRIDQQVVMVESATATKPDLRWELVDAAGHFHAYDLEGNLPTLERRSVHMECSGVCDDEECEGYDVTVFSCQICGQEIEPKRVSDRGPRAIPGRSDWSATVRAHVARGESVSLRMVTPAGEFFGMAMPTSMSGGSDGVTTTLVSNGPLGRRNRPPKCTCPLVDTSVPGGPPAFTLGDPTGCKVHGQARAAEIEEAKRRARGEAVDPFYETQTTST